MSILVISKFVTVAYSLRLERLNLATVNTNMLITGEFKDIKNLLLIYTQTRVCMQQENGAYIRDWPIN